MSDGCNPEANKHDVNDSKGRNVGLIGVSGIQSELPITKQSQVDAGEHRVPQRPKEFRHAEIGVFRKERTFIFRRFYNTVEEDRSCIDEDCEQHAYIDHGLH